MKLKQVAMVAASVLALFGTARLVAQSHPSALTVLASSSAAPNPSAGHVHGVAEPQDTSSQLPPIIPREEEIALAESAGPPGVAKDATIYVLERGKGFTIAREGKNGFACIVNRDRADTLEPECFDPEGVASILPTALERARLREEGKSAAEIDKSIAEGYASGRFRAPRRGGVTYMLSTKNRVFNGQRVISYPPHVMIMAPYVKNSDIGADFKNPMMPWVLGEGTPHAYIMVVTTEWPPKPDAAKPPASSPAQ